MKPRRGGILINVNKKEDAFLDTLYYFCYIAFLTLSFYPNLLSQIINYLGIYQNDLS